MIAGSSLTALIDVVIAFTLIEGALLLIHHRLTGRGVGPADFLTNMISGLALMLALRGLAGGAEVRWLVLLLVGAGIAHAFDIGTRWFRSTRRGNALDKHPT